MVIPAEMFDRSCISFALVMWIGVRPDAGRLV